MKNVLLFLARGFETYEASVFIDCIGWNYAEGDGTTELKTCGMRGEVTSSFNQRVVPDLTLDTVRVDNFDALAIPGGFEEYGFYEDAYHETFLALIREFHRQNKLIASVCVGALPIAKSGILKGRPATTYALGDGRRTAQLAALGAQFVNEPIVITDGTIITSRDPSTAVSVAFLLLELLTSKENAGYVRTIMGFSG